MSAGKMLHTGNFVRTQEILCAHRKFCAHTDFKTLEGRFMTTTIRYDDKNDVVFEPLIQIFKITSVVLFLVPFLTEGVFHHGMWSLRLSNSKLSDVRLFGQLSSQTCSTSREIHDEQCT